MSAQERVLVIDDNQFALSLVKKCLKRDDFEVVAHQDPRAGLEEALSGDFQLFILDLMMPGLSGFDIMERLRQEGREGRVPLLVLTARDDRESRSRAIMLGADDFLVKPFELDELSAKAKALLKVGQLRHRLEEAEKRLRSADGKEPGFDRGAVLSHLDRIISIAEKLSETTSEAADPESSDPAQILIAAGELKALIQKPE